MSDILAKNSTATLLQDIYREMFMNIRPFWNEKEKMNENVKKMFQTTYKALPEMDIADRLIAAQKMTNIALNCFTPVGSEKAYEKYRNNYYIQNTNNADIQYFTKYKGNIDNLVNNVKVELGLVKERINIPAEEINGNDSKKSAPIEQHDSPVQKIVKE